MAYHGTGTTYPGSPVGPLQDTTLTIDGSNAGTPENEFSVFNSLTYTAAGLALPQNQGMSTSSSAPAAQMTAAVASNRAPAVVAATTIFIFPPAATAGAAQPIVAAPVLTSGSLFPLTGPPLTAFAGFAAHAESVRAGSPGSVEPAGTIWQDEYRSVVDARRRGQVSDRVLDDLVTGLVAPTRFTDLLSVKLPGLARAVKNSALSSGTKVARAVPAPVRCPQGRCRNRTTSVPPRARCFPGDRSAPARWHIRFRNCLASRPNGRGEPAQISSVFPNSTPVG